LKLIFNFHIQQWCCFSKSKIDIIQRCQTIPVTYWIDWFERNDVIHHDMTVLTQFRRKNQRFTRKHETMLDCYVNPLAIKL
ncbi:Uncharacterized protein FWK35_00035359, partial [Aphis craccivora]